MPTRLKSTVWPAVKIRLAGSDRSELVGLIHDLYFASAANRDFLHTRLRIGDDLLAPYKAKLDRWLWPDVLKRQQTSVERARKAVDDFRDDLDDPAGLAELLVFWCERAAGFAKEHDVVDHDAEGYVDALVEVFGEALDAIAALPETSRKALHDRLWAVRDVATEIGHGVPEDMEDAFAQRGVE
jgi:hypothetical protein